MICERLPWVTMCRVRMGSAAVLVLTQLYLVHVVSDYSGLDLVIHMQRTVTYFRVFVMVLRFFMIIT